jgi:nitroimidazol reductase NimA-like FMN-containing flavoprotein (pyridoxamine 5'-phosphate oxidase superfamily)
MTDSTSGAARNASRDAKPAAGGTIEDLNEAECLRLISPGGVGRIAFTGRYGPTVLPVNYKVHQGDIIFRTRHESATDEDLRTGIENATYRVAFEIDDFSTAAREGWSVLVQGGARHIETEDELLSAQEAGVEPWAGGERDLFLRVIPSRITGRRIRQQ